MQFILNWYERFKARFARRENLSSWTQEWKRIVPISAGVSTIIGLVFLPLLQSSDLSSYGADLMWPPNSIEKANEHLRDKPQEIIWDSIPNDSYAYYFLIDKTIKQDTKNTNIQNNSNALLQKIKALDKATIPCEICDDGTAVAARLKKLTMSELVTLYALLRLKAFPNRGQLDTAGLRVCYYTGKAQLDKSIVSFKNIVDFLDQNEAARMDSNSKSDILDIIKHIKGVNFKQKKPIVTILSDFDHEPPTNRISNTTHIKDELEKGLNNIHQLNLIQFAPKLNSKEDTVKKVLNMMMNTAKMGAGNATYIDLLDKAVLSNTKQDEHHVTDFIDFLLVPTHLNSKTELIFYKGKVQNGDASYSSQFTIAPKNKDDDGLVFKNNFIEPYVNYTYQSTSHIVRDTPHLLVYQRHERLIKGRFPDKKPDFDTYLTLYPVYADGKSDFQKYQIKIKFEEKLYTKAYILGSIAFLICIGFFVLLSLLPIMVANRLILGSYPNVFLILTAILLYFYIIAFIYLDLTRGIDNAFYFRCILKTMIAIGFGGLMYHATQKP